MDPRNFRQKVKDEILKTQQALRDEPVWRTLWAGYADAISDPDRMKRIERVCEQLPEWDPFTLNLNVTKLKKSTRCSVTFDLRYLGQVVAEIHGTIDDECENIKFIILTDKKRRTDNSKWFKCDIQIPKGCDWISGVEAIAFRKYFKDIYEQDMTLTSRIQEHRLESSLLTRFIEKDYAFPIVPVLYAGKRFAMPTPLSASRGRVKYSGRSGGGIDILTRVGWDEDQVNLCIVELKTAEATKGPAEKAILQAVRYTVFIRELLHSESGQKWWNLFGFSGLIPNNLLIHAACAMPDSHKADISFYHNTFDIGEDRIWLQYIYFKEARNIITVTRTSLPNCLELVRCKPEIAGTLTVKERMCAYFKEIGANDPHPCGVIWSHKDIALGLTEEDKRKVMDIRQNDPDYDGFDDYEPADARLILDKYR